MIITFYGNTHLPREIVQTIIDSWSKFVSVYFLPSIKHDIINCIKNEKDTNRLLTKIDKILAKYDTIFVEVDSEHKRFNILKTYGFIQPKEYRIGVGLEEQSIGNDSKIVQVFKYGVSIPLSDALKFYLRLPGIFSKVLQFFTQLKQDTPFITNLIQGEFWKTEYMKKHESLIAENKRSKHSILLPLNIYFDELEPGHSLGSHAGTNKIGAVYASIASLPPYLASQLNSILLSALIFSKDMAECTTTAIFRKLVDDLNSLSTIGIYIGLENIDYVYFQCVMLLGDNLGLNTLLDMIKCFRADYCCRICTASYQQIQSLVEEDEKLLRSADEYDKADFENGDDNEGFFKKSGFNLINGFHILKNFSVDIMHDVLEGVAEYDLVSILNYCMYDKQYFTIDFLNMRIKNFNYLIGGDCNKPTAVKYDPISKGVKIHMSAAEMKCFLRYLGLIIGDKIPRDDKVWRLYILLRRIIDIIVSPKVTKESAQQLKKFIKDHNSLYKNLFKETLKPKFHFLIHYPRLLLRFGPLVNFWSIRFESRHRDIKAAYNSASGSKDALMTIAIKQSLKLCDAQSSFETHNPVIFGAKDFSLCETNVLNSIPENAIENFLFVKNVEIYGTLFSLKTTVLVEIGEEQNTFGKILKIFKSGNSIYFVVDLYEEIDFDDHYYAYSVKKTSKIKSVEFKDLPNFPPCSMHETKDSIYVTTPYAI